MKRKRKLVIFLIAVLVIIVTITSLYLVERKKCYVEPTEILLSTSSGDTYSYRFYSITKDKVVYYDFTDYNLQHDYNFNYFTNPLPTDGDFVKEEYAVKDGDWEKVLKSLQNNLFIDYPHTVGPVVMDGGYTSISVITKDNQYSSSAYIYNRRGFGLKYKGFCRVADSLYDLINDAK